MADWQPIKTHPTDGTEVFIYRPGWDSAPVASWGIIEGGDEYGYGGFFAWQFKDDTEGAMGDGILWPEEQSEPTLWAPVPGAPEADDG